MKSKEQIEQTLQYFQSLYPTTSVDEEALYQSYEQTSNHHSLAIKILSIFGGTLASLTFIGFLFLAGLYDSGTGMLITGILLLTCSIWMNKEFDTILLDTASISAFLISLVLIAVGLTALQVNYNIILVMFILLSAGLLLFIQNYIFAFISILVINGCVLMLMMSNELFDLIHLWIAIITVSLIFLFHKEAHILASYKRYIALYNPIRIGLIISLLFCLFFLARGGLFPFNGNVIWLSSLVMLAGIVYNMKSVIKTLEVVSSNQQYLIYGMAILLLIPTAPSPAIMGSLLILLLCYGANFKTGAAIGIIAFIYALGQYYYDLHFSLLIKSILMFTSGLLFIGLFLVTRKKLNEDEKH